MIFFAVATVIGTYLLGSINFAVIFTKAFTKKDVRDFGSGNAGSTNALRVGGKITGILTFVCDMLKGFSAALVGSLVFSYVAAKEIVFWANPVYGAFICGLACMIGHIFPIFFGFRGGKGVATGLGIFLFCCPKAIVIGLLVFIIGMLISKTVSLSSLLATTAVIVCTLIFNNGEIPFVPQLVICLVYEVIIFVRHTENIKRLINGTENKFAFGGKKNG